MILFDLERFVIAQAPVFPAVLDELRAGRKRSHWMWFIFPQLRSLGHSAMADFYGIGSLEEARAYLAHPVLGPRLDLCTRLVLKIENNSLHQIFGSPDDMKFRSSIGATAEWTKERGSSSRTPALGTRRLRRRQRVRLEGGGHKLPRPGEAGTIERGGLEKPLPSFLRDRGFESVFLQRRVGCEPDFLDQGDPRAQSARRCWQVGKWVPPRVRVGAPAERTNTTSDAITGLS